MAFCAGLKDAKMGKMKRDSNRDEKTGMCRPL